jgi:hypothetical protein
MKLLLCGHQCLSICGEDCPVDYCQKCGIKLEQSPDIILGTLYCDININESPIVVLGCGHFWTIETLNGYVGLKDVYEMDPRTRGFISLIDNRELQAVVPKCPGGCSVPIKQHAT